VLKAMANFQSEVAGKVLSFASRAHATACLTPLDRMDIVRWQDRARLAGFDRMVIHDREEGDSFDIGNFLSVHRSGQAWSRWGFARKGATVTAWCCLTGADVGTFASLSDAFEAVLAETGPVPAMVDTGCVVTDLVPKLRIAGGRFGSAA